ncbi:unnamed protein product [Aspergillus oryzae]|nr:unnamed protein product [Aspergillus oryzae]GMF91083.1 unnamed protein product [Aspergillus oryzae]GMG12319.1 unnamed protein product [Aspergillus oryzae]
MVQHLRLKHRRLPEYNGYVQPPISRQARGPMRSKIGPTTKSAVPAMAESKATFAFAATVPSTWPEPPIPVRALYICVKNTASASSDNSLAMSITTYAGTAKTDETN